jgi:DNA-binding NarL/FixJ family response regulator
MRRCVLLVDDNALIRKAIRAIIEAEDDFEVCGEAQHGREAIEKAPALKPHLILLDCAMPVMNGLDAAPHLLRVLPGVFLILFSLYPSELLERAARAAGIHAVIPKHLATTHLIPAARDLFETSPPPSSGQTAAA